MIGVPFRLLLRLQLGVILRDEALDLVCVLQHAALRVRQIGNACAGFGIFTVNEQKE